MSLIGSSLPNIFSGTLTSPPASVENKSAFLSDGELTP